METKRAYRIIHPKSISELKKYVDEPKRYAVIYKTRDGIFSDFHSTPSNNFNITYFIRFVGSVVSYILSGVPLYVV